MKGSSMLKRAIVCGVALVAMFMVQSGFAQEKAADVKGGEAEIQVDKMGMKFVRGITNCATGWGEIPRQIVRAVDEYNDEPWMIAPVGLMSGIFMTVARTMTGVIETAFFYVPFNGNYDCFLDPAYVWNKAEGDNKENQ